MLILKLSRKTAVLCFAILLFTVMSTIFLSYMWAWTMQAFGFDLLFALGDLTGIRHRNLLTLILSPILSFGFSFILALPIAIIFRVSSFNEAIIFGSAAVIGRHILYYYASIKWISEDATLVISILIEDIALVLGVIVAVVLVRLIKDWGNRLEEGRES